MNILSCMWLGFFGGAGGLFFVFLKFWPRHGACGILVPQIGIEPTLSAVEARSPNQ